MFSALTVADSVLNESVPPGCRLSTLYETGFPNGSNVMPSTQFGSLVSSSSVTRSASMSCMSSVTFDLSAGFRARRMNASPSWQRAMRMVRSFAGRCVFFAHTPKSCSILLLVPSSSRSIWSLGPVPIVSSASVFTIPLA